MFLSKLRNKIEAERGSPIYGWQVLVKIKDALWTAYLSPPIIFYYLKLSLWSLWLAHKNKGLFRDVQTYCQFIGYPRSGHSLVGSLLDAHPEMVIAQELNALNFFRLGLSKAAVFSLILLESKKFTDIGRMWNGYSYYVPGQAHSQYQKLLVIGDKKGEGTNTILSHHPKMLEVIKNKLPGIKVKYIHIIRNPFDNIATIARLGKISLPKAIDYYFALADNIIRVKTVLGPDDLIDIKHEDLMAQAKQNLKALCQHLGVTAPESYLDNCAKIIWSKPHKSRYESDWTPHLIDEVSRRLNNYDFLKDYSYND